MLSVLSLGKLVQSSGDLMPAISSLARMSLPPMVVLVAAYSSKNDSKNALLVIRCLGIAQIPLLALNEFGLITPIPSDALFSAQDRYQGLFINSGPYLSLAVLMIWLAVEFIRRPSWTLGVPFVLSGFALTYWTENRLFTLAFGTSIVVALIAMGGSRVQAIFRVGMALAILIGAIYLSVFVEPRTWGKYVEGSKGFAAISVTSAGSSRIGDQDETDRFIRTRADALLFLTEDYFKWDRELFLGVPLARGLTQAGFDSREKFSQLPVGSNGLIAADASVSIGVGAHTTILGVLTELGLVGAILYICLFIFAFRELSFRVPRLVIYVFLPLIVFLGILSPVLEGHILTAVLCLAMMSFNPPVYKYKFLEPRS